MHLTIRGRLATIVALSLLPVVLLGYLFVAQSFKDIAFAEKEKVGAAYFTQLTPEMLALAGGKTRERELEAEAVRSGLLTLLAPPEAEAAPRKKKP